MSGARTRVSVRRAGGEGLGRRRADASSRYRGMILRVLAPMVPDKQRQKQARLGHVVRAELDRFLVQSATSDGYAREAVAVGS